MTQTAADRTASRNEPVASASSDQAPVLEVERLQTFFFTRQGVLRAVDGVGFSVGPGETLAIVGESGCGKSVTALSLMRLVPDPPGRIIGGSVKLAGRELLALDEEAMRRVRGKDISMIFQEPMTSLNPVMTIGRQITEALLLHEKLSRPAARRKAIEMLRLVRISDPEHRVREYPHQLSGGMRQRAMIAMALACTPQVLIADEPTTALDVTIQAQILDIILELQSQLGTAVILITHDLGVVAEMAQRVIVMLCGAQGGGSACRRPVHPSTASLHPRPFGVGSAPHPQARRSPLPPGIPAGDPRNGSPAHQPAPGLRLRAALCMGRRQMPPGIPAV